MALLALTLTALPLVGLGGFAALRRGPWLQQYRPQGPSPCADHAAGRHAAGETIRYSDLHQALRKRGDCTPARRACARRYGHLERRPGRTIDRWLTGSLEGIAPAIRHDVHRWALLLLDGGPRTRPRHRKTVRIHIAALRPVPLGWSTRFEHLREITRDEVLDRIRAERGRARLTTSHALRSLFRWAKAHQLVFRDPTSRITVGRVELPIPQPLTPAEIAPTVKAAAAHIRVAVALAAIHAARHGDILTLQLSDVDLGNRRLRVDNPRTAAHRSPPR